MDEETTAKIFDPYFTTKGLSEGTGLGLAVVHGIVTSHGGCVRVHSELGRGTKFHVYLPVYTAKTQIKILEHRETSPEGGCETLLFVDDDVNILEIARKSLSRYGYTVHVFTNGIQAYQEIQAHPDKYDLIITDMTMPQMTGMELFLKVKKIRPDLPLILCTGYSTLIDDKTALAMGIKGYCEKPVSTKTIAFFHPQSTWTLIQ